MAVELEERRLTMRLSIRNTDREPFSFTCALHTYLRVADVSRVRVQGLQGVRYQDKTRGMTVHEEREAELRIDRETDRVYLDAPREVRVVDEAGGRTLWVRSEGFADTVVWNPWIELAASLPDFGDEEYREMICVEAAQVGRPVELAPGAGWEGSQSVELG